MKLLLLMAIVSQSGVIHTLDSPESFSAVSEQAMPGVLAVVHDGATFYVHGQRDQSTGMVKWSLDDPFNWENYRRAKGVPGFQKPGNGTVSSSSPNYGIDPSKLFRPKGNRTEEITASSEEAKRFIEQAGTGQEKRLHLTVIGPSDLRKKVIEDVNTHPALSKLKDSLWVQDYDPGDWEVSEELGYESGGKPTIMIQDSSGRVVWRASNYSSGPDALAEAIRKASPDYDPSADPGPVKMSGSCPLGFTNKHWPAVFAILIISFVLSGRSPRKAAV